MDAGKRLACPFRFTELSAPVRQRVGNRAQIDEFQLASDRHATRQTCHLQPARPQRFADRIGRGLAFGGETGGENHFLNLALGGALNQAFGMRDERGPERPGGWWILDEPECHLAPDTRVVVPDVAGWRRERMPNPPRDTHKIHVPPDWVCEVLSPSTEAYDRGRKFEFYRKLASLREYLVVSQDAPHIDRFFVDDLGRWTLTDASGLDAALDVSSIDCSLRLADVYDRIEFEADDVQDSA